MVDIDNIEVVAPGKLSIPDKLPLFASSEMVIFPGIIVPMAISDETVINMINDVSQGGGPRMIATIMRKRDSEKVESLDDVYEIGTVMMILKLLRMPDGGMRIIGQGVGRFKLRGLTQTQPYPIGEIEMQQIKSRKTVRLEALMRTVREAFDKVAELTPQLPEEFKAAVHSVEDAGMLADLIAANINIDSAARQSVLEAISVPDRLRLVKKLLDRETKILEIGSSMQDKTKEEINKSQREYFLRQQLKMIKKELGEDEEGGGEAAEWRKRVDEADLPEEVVEVANKEIERLERMNPASAEYSVITTYLDYLVTLPWTAESDTRLDLAEARKVLDEDHYGLEDVKERILEVLAVQKLKPQAPGPIICLVGPPGVGKTSLGQSIARAMGRQFVRMALGGVRDEAEIRGHRRTYVGAMPGRILQNIKKVGVRNPLFMLDEIDKLVSDFRGDPSSALLEVLDPAQNHTFADHYIEVEFDLSKVFFITTANYEGNIPPPLKDRMEVIRLSGYIPDEKVQIAKNYLVPRQIDVNGLLKKHIRFTDKALEDMVTFYTREAGVRNLERTIAKVCRKVALDVAENKSNGQAVVKHTTVEDFLGPHKITPHWVRRRAAVGVTTGLAYTTVGGTVLEIETNISPGKGRIQVTGQLGDVMKESAHIALSWIKGNKSKLGIKGSLLEKQDLHLHVPEGAVPKDGPSAGVTMATSLVSLFSNRRVRKDVAMTGEVTLTGKVLPIGGLREKVVAANRSRVKHVIIPWDNRKDLEDVPDDVRAKIEFHPVKNIQEVLDIALMKK